MSMQNERTKVTVYPRSEGPQEEEEEVRPLLRWAKHVKALPGERKGTEQPNIPHHT